MREHWQQKIETCLFIANKNRFMNVRGLSLSSFENIIPIVPMMMKNRPFSIPTALYRNFRDKEQTIYSLR